LAALAGVTTRRILTPFLLFYQLRDTTCEVIARLSRRLIEPRQCVLV
jgi:hypothetical protein